MLCCCRVTSLKVLQCDVIVCCGGGGAWVGCERDEEGGFVGVVTYDVVVHLHENAAKQERQEMHARLLT